MSSLLTADLPKNQVTEQEHQDVFDPSANCTYHANQIFKIFTNTHCDRRVWRYHRNQLYELQNVSTTYAFLVVLICRNTIRTCATRTTR